MKLKPLPPEKELRVAIIKSSLSELSREELEDFLSQAIDKLTRLTHQSSQLLEMVITLSRGVEV